MPKRVSRTKRKLQRLQRVVAAGLQSAQSNHQDTVIGRWPPEQREAYVKQWANGNLTTGPERTPLRPWTPEEVEAYKKMRLEEVREQLLQVTKPMTDAEARQADAEHERRWDRFFKND